MDWGQTYNRHHQTRLRRWNNRLPQGLYLRDSYLHRRYPQHNRWYCLQPARPGIPCNWAPRHPRMLLLDHLRQHRGSIEAVSLQQHNAPARQDQQP